MPPSQTAAERFATIIRCLTEAVWTRSHFGLSSALIALITTRLREINQRVRRIAARVRAGTYAPPRRGPRHHPPGEIRRPDKLPRSFGWMLKLVPRSVDFRSQLQALLQDPEMAALLAAAPAPLRRPIRSLCRMLFLPAPAILAIPKKPRPATPPPPPQPPAASRPPRRRATPAPPPPASAHVPPIPA